MQAPISGSPRGNNVVCYRRSLAVLPDDVLLEIYSHLNAEYVLVLSQLARTFHTLSSSFIVWHNILLGLLHRARYIDLLAIDWKQLKDVTVPQLRQSIVVAVSAEKNWLNESPKVVVNPQTLELGKACLPMIALDQVPYIAKFSSKHLIIPLADGGLLVWDMKENEAVGRYEMDADHLLIDLALDRSSRSLFCLIGKVAPVRHNHSFGMHVRFSVVRIGIPEPDSTEPLCFEKTTRMTILVPIASEVHLLDVSRRMYCVLFSCFERKTMGVLLFFDWDTEATAIFDTGIPYAYGRSMIGMRLSADGDFLILHSKDGASEIRRWYCLADLPRSAGTWNALEFEPKDVEMPARQESFEWDNELKIFSEPDTLPYLFWRFDQKPPQSYCGIPDWTSTIILYITVPNVVLDTDPSQKTWRIAQYYSDQDGPCAPARSVVTLSNPALIPNDLDDIPILCLSFNHFGWIEEINFEKTKKRVLKLLTFPDPGTNCEDDLADTARILDVPSDVLDKAYHMLLDATQGQIIVAVSDALHIYHY